MSLQKSKNNRVKKTITDSFQKDFEEIKKGSRSEMTMVSQNYLKAIVDTRSAPKVGVPTNIGGFPGRTGIVRYTEQLEVYTGTTGFGYVSVNLAGNSLSPFSGPFNDTAAIEYTTAAYIGNQIPVSGLPIPAGIAQNAWRKSEFSRTGIAKESELQYRVVGCTIKIFPEASALSQNGRIILLEPPSHTPLNLTSGITGSTIENAPTAHVIRAVQTGDLKEQVVLNWHPRGYEGGKAGRGDFDFLSTENSVITPAILPATDLVVGFQCNTVTPSQFHVEITVMYELRGLRINNVKPRLVDTRGMDLIQNVFSSKLVSGYIGKPEHVYESYLYKVWEGARKFGGFLSRHEKEITEGVGRGLKALGGFM
jgi:hypothetical protein